jgi:hypothetical protein
LQKSDIFATCNSLKSQGEPGLAKLREIALFYNVDHSTISRLKARHTAEISLIPRGLKKFGVDLGLPRSGPRRSRAERRDGSSHRNAPSGTAGGLRWRCASTYLAAWSLLLSGAGVAHISQASSA